MNRLTTRRRHCVMVDGCATIFLPGSKSPMTRAINRLAAYEDTDLTPGEVELYVKCQAMQMSKREASLRVELEKVKAELENVKMGMDAALNDIPHLCRTCANGFYGDNGFDCDQASYESGCKYCLSWLWRGWKEV